MAAQEQYQTDLATYQKDLGIYEQEWKDYERQKNLNTNLEENYQKELDQYEKDLAHYKLQEQSYEKEKQEQDQAQAEFNQKQIEYQSNLKLYQRAEAVYQDALAQAQKDSQKDGFLSQVYAQYLIAKSEPNATVHFEGVKDFITSPHDFGENLDGIAGTISKLPVSSKPNLFKGVGSATAAGAGDGYGVILEKNQPIRVTYSNLSNTSYNGRKITRLVYTYELVSTFAQDGKATALIYTDPTKTIYVGSHGDNKGDIDFAINQTMTYFFEDGTPVIFDQDKTALLSFASRNNTFEFGEQEFVQLGSNLTFIPITGSSVSGENGYIAARGSNNSKADGSKFDRSEWDQDGNPNEYYGAGVAVAKGETISFTFGIRYHPTDLQRAKNPSGLRSRSRQWFTVNADIKASGLINLEKPGTSPIQPVAPTILNKVLLEPKAPIKPKQPEYKIGQIPVKPREPRLKEIPLLIPPPKMVSKPIPPRTPVLIVYPIVYQKPAVHPASKPAVRPVQFKKPQPLNPPVKPVIAQRRITPTYYAPLQGISRLTPPNYRSITPSYLPPTPIYRAQPQAAPQNRGKDNKQKPSNKKAKKSETKRDYFGENTKIDKKSGDQQRLIAFIEEVGRDVRKRYKNFSGSPAQKRYLIDRDIALALAHHDYHKDVLQNLFNRFGQRPIGSKAKYGIDVLEQNHRDKTAKVDLSHTMTTLASTYDSSFITSMVKHIASNFTFGFPSIRNITATIQLNSLTGDLFTNMGLDDINADLDSMILARHPNFKNMPMDQRIIAYYSQPDLDKNRKKLFYELYSDNEDVAKKLAAMEIVLATMTMGGIGLILVSKLKQYKTAKQNIKNLDDEIFGGELANLVRSSAPFYANPFIGEAKGPNKESKGNSKSEQPKTVSIQHPLLGMIQLPLSPDKNKKEEKKGTGKKAFNIGKLFNDLWNALPFSKLGKESKKSKAKSTNGIQNPTDLLNKYKGQQRESGHKKSSGTKGSRTPKKKQDKMSPNKFINVFPNLTDLLNKYKGKGKTKTKSKAFSKKKTLPKTSAAPVGMSQKRASSKSKAASKKSNPLQAGSKSKSKSSSKPTLSLLTQSRKRQNPKQTKAKTNSKPTPKQKQPQPSRRPTPKQHQPKPLPKQSNRPAPKAQPSRRPIPKQHQAKSKSKGRRR